MPIDLLKSVAGVDTTCVSLHFTAMLCKPVYAHGRHRIQIQCFIWVAMAPFCLCKQQSRVCIEHAVSLGAHTMSLQHLDLTFALPPSPLYSVSPVTLRFLFNISPIYHKLDRTSVTWHMFKYFFSLLTVGNGRWRYNWCVSTTDGRPDLISHTHHYFPS